VQPRLLKDINVAGKKVLVRVDYNVPLDAQQNITDDFRIEASLETIQYLLQQDAIVILMSHLGRPKGNRVAEMSLAPAAKRLSEMLKQKVIFVDDCVGEIAEKAVAMLAKGSVALLENLRFHKEETSNDDTFSKQLAALADVYINDAFGTAHRAHASNVGITAHFSEKGIGFLLQKEIEFLVKTIETPERPFTVIMGGAKISGKIDLIEKLSESADSILIGGGMAYTFLSAPPYNYNVGNSLVEEDRKETATLVVEKFAKEGKRLALPSDSIVAKEISPEAETRIFPIEAMKMGWMGLDIGPKTQKEFKSILETSKTVLWNGPMGVFEVAPFANGTKFIAEYLVELTEKGVTTIIGGGDSAAALKAFGLEGRVSHTSTGGGASLELLSGAKLPAFEALKG
jgi:3-phosphoglycerate kinase